MVKPVGKPLLPRSGLYAVDGTGERHTGAVVKNLPWIESRRQLPVLWSRPG